MRPLSVRRARRLVSRARMSSTLCTRRSQTMASYMGRPDRSPASPWWKLTVGWRRRASSTTSGRRSTPAFTACGSAASSSPAPQPTSSTEASSGISRASVSWRSWAMKSRAAG
jgi:hypothetical protein